MKTDIVNFLWVASSYTDPGVPAFQIAVRRTAETLDEVDALGGVRVKVDEALNISQAAEMGIDLKVITKTLKTEALIAVETMAARIADLEAQLADQRRHDEGAQV